MAKITRLASTLIARYYPSKTLTDAFYMDGRLFGKRETRNADITIDKEERGFFFSVFSHPSIPGYEPGMLPPYEPLLRNICNDVKFGRKPIDELISGFLSSSVEITGKMKLQDQDNRAPYFSGFIVRDSEAFAVTIGSGLAFLYRNDALYPLTEAGIPMEPIDTFGNRVADFNNYVSSKTASAMWSNITTLAVDDCVILCNKAVYDALGQRELLRILDEAEDQCDAAGTVITQAAANMPNVPMQFSISFVESVTADEKKGFFKFGRKKKEEDMENMSIKSTFDGGIIGAAAGAVANAGFATGVDAAAVTAAETTAASAAAAVSFGDEATSESVKPSSADDILDSVVPEVKKNEVNVEFLDSSVPTEAPKEISAEDMMKSLFSEMEQSKQDNLEIQKKAEEEAAAPSPFVMEEPTPATSIITEGTAFAPQTSEIPSDSPFVSEYNPFAASVPEKMEPVAEVPFEEPESDGMLDTKTVSAFDSLFVKQVSDENGIASNGIIAAALREMQAENATKDEPSEPEIILPKEEITAPETPVVPTIPVVAEEPVAPVVPVIPVVAEEPVVPVVPVIPVVAEEPVAPVVPEIPVVAEEPVAPVVPEIPVVAEEPVAPVVPESQVVAEEPVVPTVDPVTVNADEITFGAGNEVLEFGDTQASSAPFNPYGIVDAEEDIQSMKPLVFPGQESGDFVLPASEIPETVEEEPTEGVPSFEWKEEEVPAAPLEPDENAPAYDIDVENQTVNPVENVSFPISKAPNAEPEKEVSVMNSDVSDNNPEVTSGDGYVLPFENAVYAEPEPDIQAKDIPDMPVYGSQTYDAPTYAVNSEQPVTDDSQQAYSVGGYAYNEDNAPATAPYQSYGSETIDDGMFESPQAYAEYQSQTYSQGEAYDPNVQPVAYDQYGQPAAYDQYGQPIAYDQYGQPIAYDQYGQPVAYDQYGQPMAEQPVAYQPGEYEQPVDYPEQPQVPQQPGYEQPAAYTPIPEDEIAVDGMGEDWINNIIGITETDGDGASKLNYIDPNADMSTGKPTTRPGNSTAHRTTQQPAKTAPKKPANNGKRKFRVTRNMIIFGAFVLVLIIGIIVIISLIAKSCSSDKKKPDTVTTEPSIEVVETTPAPTPVPDPKAPIGVFAFSDYTGYRTWYDLFNKVYGIQIENESDSRIATIIAYNGAGEGYVPKSGDSLLLPPIGIVNGSIPLDGSTEAAPEEPVDAAPVETGTVEGEPSVVQ